MKTFPLVLSLAGLLGAFSFALADDASGPAGATKVPLIFRDGHDTDPVDRGRPVVLVAAALGVPPKVFRDAFSHVHPAGPGQQPQPDDVRENKRQLLSRLSPYGVTNERLDEVSNYYRYRRESGELWRHVDAEGFAMVAGGKIVSITITNPGAGYSSAPKVSLQAGLTEYPLAIVAYGKDLTTNGSISKIVTSPIGDDNHSAPMPISPDLEVPQARPPPGNNPGTPPPPPPPPQ